MGAKLVLKHNHESPNINHHPNIINIIGELSDADMEFIHETCNCYVNLSFSEGVGLGIVEAAIRNKPIIMTDYGGQNDYVKTPWLIKTTIGEIGFDEFLFNKGMHWGIPDYESYKNTLREINSTSHKVGDHSDTRKIVSRKNIKKILKKHGL